MTGGDSSSGGYSGSGDGSGNDSSSGCGGDQGASFIYCYFNNYFQNSMNITELYIWKLIIKRNY